MTAALFTLTFAVAAPFWALMLLLPHWSWTVRIIRFLGVRTRWVRPAVAPAPEPQRIG
jgi:hypothetical protein